MRGVGLITTKMFIFYSSGFVFLYLIYTVFFLALLAGLVYLFSILDNFSSEKLSTYECGFTPLSDMSGYFESGFCTLAVIFLLFDIEILFLLP